jgi:hypothetical protein
MMMRAVFHRGQRTSWPGGDQLAFKENFVPWRCLYLLVRYLKQGVGAEFFPCSVDCLIISLTTKIIGVAVNRRCSRPSNSPAFHCHRNIFSKSYFSVLFSGWFRGFSTKNRSIKVRGFY